MNDAQSREWIEEAKRRALASWDQKRGIETAERNGHSVHVRAGVEQTAAELSRTAVRWEKDVLNKPVCPGAANLVVFRLRGHSWTVIVDEVVDAEELSRSLQTEVIDYTVSDTCDCIGYTLFDKGERTEAFFGSEEDGTNVFESTIRSVSDHERQNIWDMVRQFFLSHDAFEPGLAYEYFFRQSGMQSSAPRLILLDAAPADTRPRVHNPGFVVVIGGEKVVSKPEFERIDFVVTRETPGKAGRILLG